MKIKLPRNSFVKVNLVWIQIRDISLFFSIKKFIVMSVRKRLKFRLYSKSISELLR